MTENLITGVSWDENWDQSFAGAGLVDSTAQILKSIQDSDEWTAAANVAAAGLDVLGVIENPVKAIGTTVVGWLIEHISFLDWYLDHTAGDPEAVQNATETFFQAAKDLDGVAAEQIRSFGTGVRTYREGNSRSAQVFEARVGPRGDQLKAQSNQCLGLGHTMNLAGMLVATCRGWIRDLLVEFTWESLKKAAIALAAAPYTGGTSVGTWALDRVATAARLAQKFAQRITDMLDSLSGLAGKLRNLAKALGDLDTPAQLAIGGLKGAVPAVTKMVEDHVSLSAADAAEEEVEIQTADDCVPGPEPAPPPPEPYGPGLGVRWTTSGTLDE